MSYREQRYRIVPVERESDVAERYVDTADRVAATDATCLDYLGRQYAVPLDDAPEHARSFFERVLRGDGTYRGERGDGYNALRDALPPNQALGNRWLARYGGDWYALSMYQTNDPYA